MPHCHYEPDLAPDDYEPDQSEVPTCAVCGEDLDAAHLPFGVCEDCGEDDTLAPPAPWRMAMESRGPDPFKEDA